MNTISQRRGLSSAALHIIAMGSMLIDHALKYAVAYDGWIIVLGRLAFPIFAFMAAEGCYYTKNPKKYGLRLLAFALLSEVPYDLMKSDSLFDVYDQNVIWTFLIAFLCIMVYRRARSTDKKPVYIAAGVGVTLAGFLVATVCSTDYGGLGVVTVLMFYFLRERKWQNMLVVFVILSVINVVFLGGFGGGFTWEIGGQVWEFPVQGFGVLALVPIWLYHGRQGYHSKPFQYLCYAFYPVHMLLVTAIGHL